MTQLQSMEARRLPQAHAEPWRPYVAQAPSVLPEFSRYRPRPGHPDFARLEREAEALARRFAPTLEAPPRGPREALRRTRSIATAVQSYVDMITLIYHLFGVTLTAGYVRCFLCIACFSAMYAMIPWFACRIGADWQGGALGGLVGAVIPQQSLGELIGWSVNEPLAAIALALLLAGFLRRWREADHLFLRALLFGMGWGVAFHFSPALLLVMLAGLAFELWWSKSRRKWLSSLLVVLGATLACLPWTWRNYAAFHEFFFIRSNLGLELRVGNHPGAAPAMEVMDAREGDRMRHPGNNRAEAVKVRELGEREYMRQAQSEAWDWIRAHPAEFLRLTAARVMHFWFGPLHQPLVAAGISLLTILAAVGAGRALPAWTPPQRAALLIPLATFPLVYYVVAYMSRYAVPVNWLLLMLAGNEVWYWIKRGGAPNNS